MTIAVGDNFQTTIRSGKSEFTINGLDANSYPHLPEIAGQNPFSISTDVLKQLIHQTVIAVSNQESRPILTGVHLVLKDGEMLAVATDSHRLAQRKLTVSVPSDGNYDVIIPGKSLIELSRTLADDVETVEIRIAENQVLFKAGNLAFYSRLLEGNYPDTARLIPTSSSTQIEFNAPVLLAAIERASLLSHESRNNVVRLTLNTTDNTAIIYGTHRTLGMLKKPFNLKPNGRRSRNFI